jgi:FixJ family two-component response regulator
MKGKGNLKEVLSIVILEDNDGDFVLMEDYLIEMYNSINVVRYDTYQSFIECFDAGEIQCDLILMDLHLPDVSGLPLVETMVSRRDETPLIILTGYADLPLAKKSLAMGVDDFLIKDEINTTLLYKSIEFALSRKNYIRHIESQNQILRKIAYSQSHEVRAPLARILGVINLLENVELTEEETKYLMEQLKVSAAEMDEIVHSIVKQTQSIKLG